MPISSASTFLGIAKETTPGTAVAATAFIPVTSLTPKVLQAYLADEGWRGSQAKTYGEVLGPVSIEYAFGGSVYPDTIGFALAGVLGEVATTGASAPFSHAIDLLNSGALTKTYTISDYNGVNTRQFIGSRFTEVNFKFAGDGLLEYDAKAMGRSTATPTKPTASFTAVVEQPGWLGIASVAGSPSSVVLSGSCSIKRSGSPLHTIDGTAAPYDVMVGGDLEVTGDLVAVYEDDTLYGDYLNGTNVALDFNWQQGAGAALTQFKLHMSSCQIDDADINRGSGKHVEIAIKYTAIANSSDIGTSAGLSPIKATLQNALAASTYV